MMKSFMIHELWVLRRQCNDLSSNTHQRVTPGVPGLLVTAIPKPSTQHSVAGMVHHMFVYKTITKIQTTARLPLIVVAVPFLVVSMLVKSSGMLRNAIKLTHKYCW